MSFLLRRQPRIAQPQRVVGVGFGAYADTLALAWSGAFPDLNQRNQQSIVAANGAIQAPGSEGLGIRFASSTNAGIKVAGPDLLKGALGNWNGFLTVYLLADPPANTTRSLPFCFSDNVVQPQSYFAFNCDIGLAANAGRWSLTDGGNGSYVDGAIDGRPHVFAAAYTSETGGGPYLYVDGEARGTRSTSLGTYAGTGQDIWIGGYSSGSWAAADYNVYGVLAFNDFHDPETVAQISRAFWAQWEPERIWVPVSAATAPTLSLPDVQSITASGATPKVTLTFA